MQLHLPPARRLGRRRVRWPARSINPARIEHARRVARLRHCGGNATSAPERPAARDMRLERAVALYQGLIDVIAGGSAARIKKLPFSLYVLEVLAQLPDVERWAVEDLITRCQEVRSSYLTVKDLAERWRTSPSTILRMVRRRELRGAYSSGRLVLTEQEADRYIRARTYYGKDRVYPDEPLVPEPFPTVERPR